MPSLAVAKVFNKSFCESLVSSNSIPVAVFVGATAGIGKATVQAFAKYTQGRAHIIIIARSRGIGLAILDALPNPNTESTPYIREFIECDVSLMRNIHNAATYIKTKLNITKIDFLVDTAGYASFGASRDNTEEGIDRQFALRYYSRWKFIDELLPILSNDAKVMSVMYAGSSMRWTINVDDLGMQKKYTWAAFIVSAIYNDYMMEEYANRHTESNISFIHMSAGVVDTRMTYYGNTNWFWRGVMWFLTQCVMPWTGITPEESAEYMLYGMFSAEKGLCLKDDKGEVLPMEKLKTEELLRRKIWEHSVEVTKTDD